MKLKLDENLSRDTIVFLTEEGHDVDTVVDEALAGSKDTEVSRAAIEAGRILITLDRDFADVRDYPPGHQPGIIVIRLPLPRPSLIRAALAGFLTQYRLDDLQGCTVIVQLGAVRIRRPNS